MSSACSLSCYNLNLGLMGLFAQPIPYFAIADWLGSVLVRSPLIYPTLWEMLVCQWCATLVVWAKYNIEFKRISLSLLNN
ncbi:hypothetical protein [Allocoleopsis sp.]|uniref:hypothetical protein n=1 Tax=Allocoleopsis sp. TaxID=3088169 RepID=UPI002FD5270C